MNTIKIHNKVKAEVERFLHSFSYNEYEWGGFLLECGGVVNKVIIVPNASNTPRYTYVFPPLSKELAEKYRYSFRRYHTVAAEWHSHPTPCIMSAGDTCYSKVHNVIEVMVTPLSPYSYSDFEWYSCKGIEPIRIQFVGRTK
jgi:hypothetical protein